jgi:hypothetical protein
MSWVFLAHVGATLMMAGLIWLIQLVHYPLMRMVGPQTFAAYHASHSQLITLIVGPLMLVELGGALALCSQRPALIPAWMAWAGLGCVGVAWLTTAFASVPAHSLLSAGFDPAAHNTLVLTNWLRTLAWSAHGGLVLAQTARLIHPGSWAA